MTDLITAEEAQKLLDGKVMARGDLRDHAGSLARTVIVLHAELAQASADAKAAVAVVVEKAAGAFPDGRWTWPAYAIRSTIRDLAPASSVAKLAALRERAEKAEADMRVWMLTAQLADQRAADLTAEVARLRERERVLVEAARTFRRMPNSNDAGIALDAALATDADAAQPAGMAGKGE